MSILTVKQHAERIHNEVLVEHFNCSTVSNCFLPGKAENHDYYSAENTVQQSHISSKAYCKHVGTNPYALQGGEKKEVISFNFYSHVHFVNQK